MKRSNIWQTVECNYGIVVVKLLSIGVLEPYFYSAKEMVLQRLGSDGKILKTLSFEPKIVLYAKINLSVD